MTSNDNSDDNSDDNSTSRRCQFALFILTAIVYVNVNTFDLATNGCDHTLEFNYIKYSFFGTIASIVAMIVIAISMACDKCSNATKFICSLVIFASAINQIVCIGILWDAYPHDYIIFYPKYWNSVRSECIESSTKWADDMMDVIVKISAGLLMLTFTCIAIGGCCRTMVCCCERVNSIENKPNQNDISRLDEIIITA